jgi:hypothetical protein
LIFVISIKLRIRVSDIKVKAMKDTMSTANTALNLSDLALIFLDPDF